MGPYSLFLCDPSPLVVDPGPVVVVLVLLGPLSLVLVPLVAAVRAVVGSAVDVSVDADEEEEGASSSTFVRVLEGGGGLGGRLDECFTGVPGVIRCVNVSRWLV